MLTIVVNVATNAQMDKAVQMVPAKQNVASAYHRRHAVVMPALLSVSI
jgi:hypothetical protein